MIKELEKMGKFENFEEIIKSFYFLFLPNLCLKKLEIRKKEGKKWGKFNIFIICYKFLISWKCGNVIIENFLTNLYLEAK